MAIIFFWKYKNTRPSRFLNLSTKQTVRYLHKWMDEGWLTFISGKGRGNPSSLQWLKNVEQIYESQVMEIITNSLLKK